MILNEQQTMIRDMARQFARDRLTPNAARWDREAHFPMEEIREMGRLGLMGMAVPVEWGGAGADAVSTALALEEIAFGDAATSTVMSGHNSVGCMPIANFGTEEQKEHFLRPMAEGRMLSAFVLTEAHGGSDAGALTTRAERDGDAYVLNGTKQFITSGKNADVALIFARTSQEAGTKGISAFIVPTGTPGYTVVRVEIEAWPAGLRYMPDRPPRRPRPCELPPGRGRARLSHRAVEPPGRPHWYRRPGRRHRPRGL